MFNSLIFDEYYLCELFQISWLVLDSRKSSIKIVVQKTACVDCVLNSFNLSCSFCLVFIVVVWLVSTRWECLFGPTECSCLALHTQKHSLSGLSPKNALFGWLGTCLHHVWLNFSQSSLHDHLVLMTCNFHPCVVRNALSLCMIMSIIALLVWSLTVFC